MHEIHEQDINPDPVSDDYINPLEPLAPPAIQYKSEKIEKSMMTKIQLLMKVVNDT